MPMKKSGLFRNKNAKATPYKDKGVTEVGKEAKTQSYKEYVQKMFGGGMTEPAMKKKNMRAGRNTMSGISSEFFVPPGERPSRPIDPVLPRGKRGRGDI
jgi:hypothetical protein